LGLINKSNKNFVAVNFLQSRFDNVQTAVINVKKLGTSNVTPVDCRYNYHLKFEPSVIVEYSSPNTNLNFNDDVGKEFNFKNKYFRKFDWVEGRTTSSLKYYHQTQCIW
jgi:hypothetical protein